MATKKELTDEIKDLTAKLKANSKDAHFAEVLVEKLLIAKGQLVAEPIELNVGTKVDSYRGTTFELVKTNRGVLYHEFGGYNIFVKPQNASLYQTLVDLVDNKDIYNKLEGEEKESFELNLSAISYCLSVPKICFSDVEFTYDIAKKVVDFLTDQYEKLMNEPLQDETVEEDEQFKAATLAIEDIKEIVSEVNLEEED